MKDKVQSAEILEKLQAQYITVKKSVYAIGAISFPRTEKIEDACLQER